MELFLNLCWLALLLPAGLVWRRRGAIGGKSFVTATPLAFLCALGCAVVLLFPVISASDDLHAMRPEMEESERSVRNVNRSACTQHSLHHSSAVLLSVGTFAPVFEQTGTVLSRTPEAPAFFLFPANSGRAPPATSLSI
jgi:hypothetical protein